MWFLRELYPAVPCFAIEKCPSNPRDLSTWHLASQWTVMPTPVALDRPTIPDDESFRNYELNSLQCPSEMISTTPSTTLIAV
jgi:hypothetical protein